MPSFRKWRLCFSLKEFPRLDITIRKVNFVQYSVSYLHVRLNQIMIKQQLTLLIFVGTAISMSAQNITIKPYLQDASPNDIYIRWETDEGDESLVEWGTSEALGNQTSGLAFASNGGEQRIHEVHLEGLERFTQYHYRVITGTAISEIYSFKTPPFASDEESFRIVAMSDMQRDGAFPDKFREVVEDGVMDYLDESIGGNITDNLALIMIPGDLVVNGNNFGSWQQTFFEPSEELLSRVPVYPVPGNHENDASFQRMELLVLKSTGGSRIMETYE